MSAAAGGLVSAVRTLVKSGANIRDIDAGGRNAFLIAAAEGRTQVVSYLLTVEKALISDSSKSGNTALHRAAAYGQTDVVEVLLLAGAAIDEKNADGATPLSRASRWGHDDVVLMLLSHGARADIADSAGIFPLEWARLKQHDDVVGMLATVKGASMGSGRLSIPSAPASYESMPHAGSHSLSISPPPPADTPASTAASAFGGAGGAMVPISEEDVDTQQYIVEDDDDVRTNSDGYGGDDGYMLGTPMHAEGWMAKQGQIFKTWKNRWFVLEGRSIFYYVKEGAPKAKGVIHMVEGTDVVIEEKYSKPFCFTISTPSRRHILQAADEDEMAEWVEAIQNNLDCLAAGDEAMDGGIAEED